MRSFTWWLSVLLAAAPLAGAALTAAAGCGDEAADGASTAGRRVTLGTRVEALSPGEPFTTGLGWKVTLSKASIATGAFYYFDGAPPFSQNHAPRRQRWASLLGPSVAWAHPGHYVPGNARGQQLSPWSVDLFAGPADLPAGEGVTGIYRSGRFSFAAPTAGPAAASLGGSVAAAAGTAEKDGATIFFAIAADLAALESRAAEGNVDGCVLEEIDVEKDGTVTATVKPSVWFNLVDFSKIAPGSADAPTAITPADDAHLGFITGLAQLSAYRFRYTP